MVRALLFCAAALVVAGCDPSVGLSRDETAQVAPADSVKGPGSTLPTAVSLLAIKGQVKVGDTVDHAYAVLPPPVEAYEFKDLPPGFQPPYAARGWESGRQGFGVITHEKLVVAAMYQLDRIDEATLNLTKRAYQDLLGAPTHQISGTNVRYWFWARELQSLVICALRSSRGLHVTIAMGDNAVLSGLRISPEEAERARARDNLPHAPAESTGEKG